MRLPFFRKFFNVREYVDAFHDAYRTSSVMRFILWLSICFSIGCIVLKLVPEIDRYVLPEIVLIGLLILAIFGYGCVRPLIGRRTDRKGLLAGVGVAKFVSILEFAYLPFELWMWDVPLTAVFIAVYWLKFDRSEHNCEKGLPFIVIKGKNDKSKIFDPTVDRVISSDQPLDSRSGSSFLDEIFSDPVGAPGDFTCDTTVDCDTSSKQISDELDSIDPNETLSDTVFVFGEQTLDSSVPIEVFSESIAVSGESEFDPATVRAVSSDDQISDDLDSIHLDKTLSNTVTSLDNFTREPKVDCDDSPDDPIVDDLGFLAGADSELRDSMHADLIRRDALLTVALGGDVDVVLKPESGEDKVAI